MRLRGTENYGASGYRWIFSLGLASSRVFSPDTESSKVLPAGMLLIDGVKLYCILEITNPLNDIRLAPITNTKQYDNRILRRATCYDSVVGPVSKGGIGARSKQIQHTHTHTKYRALLQKQTRAKVLGGCNSCVLCASNLLAYRQRVPYDYYHINSSQHPLLLYYTYSSTTAHLLSNIRAVPGRFYDRTEPGPTALRIFRVDLL